MGGSQMRAITIPALFINFIFANPIFAPDLHTKYVYQNEIYEEIFSDSVTKIDTGIVGYIANSTYFETNQRIFLQRSRGNYTSSFFYYENRLKVAASNENYLFHGAVQKTDTVIARPLVDFYTKSPTSNRYGVHNSLLDSSKKTFRANTAQDSTTATGLYGNPNDGSPSYQFYEKWVRGLGLVEMTFFTGLNTGGNLVFDKPQGLPENPFNPNYDNYHLAYVIKDADTLYNHDKPYTPVKTDKNFVNLGEQLISIPNPFNSSQNLQIEWLSAGGQNQSALWTLDHNQLQIRNLNSSTQRWIRISQGQQWRVYRIN